MHFRHFLFSYNLYQDPLPSPAVKFTVKDLFPGAEIKFSLGDGHHHLPAHDLAFQMRVGVVLPVRLVAILTDGFVGGHLFQPLLIFLKTYRKNTLYIIQF